MPIDTNEKTPEPTKSFELTQTDQDIILLALGGLTAMDYRDSDRKLSGLGEAALRVARKFGVTY